MWIFLKSFGTLFFLVVLFLVGVTVLPYVVEMESVKSAVSQCWTCPIISDILKATGNIVDRVYADGGILKGCYAMLTIGFAIWIIYYTMQFIGSPKMGSPGKYWSDLMTKTLLVIFIGILLSASNNFMELFSRIVFPFIRAFMELGMSILNSSNTDASACTYAAPTVNAPAPGAFFRDLASNIGCLVQNLHTKAAQGMVVGAKLITSQNTIWMIIVGLIVYVFFFILLLLFPLQLFDTLFRLAIAMVLFPLAILLFAFKFTRRYSHKVFRYFFYVAVHLPVLCLIFAICMTVVIQFMIRLDPNLMTVNGLENFSQDALRRVSNLEYRDFALISIVFYMYYILHSYLAIVNSVTGAAGLNDEGTSMAKGVKGLMFGAAMAAAGKMKNAAKTVPGTVGALVGVQEMADKGKEWITGKPTGEGGGG